jgi:hypothetical protein
VQSRRRARRFPPAEPGPLVAGGHRSAAAQSGFDPCETTITVVPDQEAPVEVLLAANSRSLVVRTELPGVKVRLDGEDVGETAGDVPELRLDRVPVGEHVIELSKPCYGSERLEKMLAVDLLERRPLIVGPVALEPLRGTIVLRGVPPGADVLLDGSPGARPGIERSAVCPGRHTLEVRAGGRAVFWSEPDVEVDAEVALDFVPRPNVALLGSSSLPPGFESLAAKVSTRPGPPLPDGLDAGSPSAWRRWRWWIPTRPRSCPRRAVPRPPLSSTVRSSGSWTAKPVVAELSVRPSRRRRSGPPGGQQGRRTQGRRVGRARRRVRGSVPGRIARIAGEAVSSAEDASPHRRRASGVPFPVESGEEATSSDRLRGTETPVLPAGPASPVGSSVRAWARSTGPRGARSGVRRRREPALPARAGRTTKPPSLGARRVGGSSGHRARHRLLPRGTVRSALGDAAGAVGRFAGRRPRGALRDDGPDVVPRRANTTRQGLLLADPRSFASARC